MTERFDDAELARYARQIVLPEIGGIGQERLRAARIALVGLGGLGCPAALYLAAAGVGQLTLIDDDVVSVGNLHRQVLFTDADLGQPKVMAGATVLRRHAPRLRVRPHVARLESATAAALLRGHDLVLDGSDNFPTRRLVADMAAALRLPLVSGSVQGTAGQLTVLAPFAAPDAPCFHCLFDTAPAPDALPTCAMDGVLGPVAGWLGTMLATEAVKELLGIGSSLRGTLLLVDGLDARIDRVRIGRRPGCRGCASGDGRTEPALAGTERGL